MYYGVPDCRPRYAPDAGRAPAACGRDESQGDHVRILLADDDPQVLAITMRILHRQAWEVVTARNGQEAVARWPRDGEPFDLVILDVNMPEMNGYEAFRALQRVHPAARILFISGYSEVSSWRQLVEEGGQPFLAKPFAPRQLVDAVRSLVDQGDGDGGEQASVG